MSDGKKPQPAATVTVDQQSYAGTERRKDYIQWRARVDKRLDDGAATMKALKEDVAENTATTKRVESNTAEVVSLLESFKGAMTVLDMVAKLVRPLGYIAMAATAFWGLFTVIKGGGEPPR